MFHRALPDLLQPEPAARIDFEQTRFAIQLAFAGSTSGGMFGDALESLPPDAALPHSTWEPGGFAEDLFLQRFVTQCFRARIGHKVPVLNARFLLRVLARPPADRAIVDFRRAILAELVGCPPLRRALENLYGAIGRLRALLENTGLARVWDANRRKLDILAAFEKVVGSMADFGQATSGLQRLADFGAAVSDGEPCRSLRDLLAYDSELATLDLRIGVGADGRMRGFEVVAIEECRDNAFHNPFWRRWLARVELFLRGYRFSQEEIMARLIDSVFTGLEPELCALVQLLGDLEFYLGALGFRDGAQSVGLAVCLPELTSAPPATEEPGDGETSRARELFGLFNPLLLLGGTIPVPCDVSIDERTSTTLVTGPNSGGKTRLLQAIGLAQLLAQSGVFVPARAGRVVLASALVASLIEQVQVDQVEGRLGMELLRIRALFERLPAGAMVLLDELCSGTNPSEGERIFELVVQMLHKLRPQAFITTHFLTFAQRLEDKRDALGMGFLQVELDDGRRPSYQFVAGVARTSLAEHTAERLGVTGEQLLQLIERNLSQTAKAAPARPLDPSAPSMPSAAAAAARSAAIAAPSQPVRRG